MKKVIAINLNGNAYQIDESGYATLVAYLDGAERQLKDNPDRAEILADLEQAIADKCQRVLDRHKTVVTAIEIQQIIAEMGPVDGATADATGTGTPGGTGTGRSTDQTDARAPRRLYQIRDGAMLAGVCNGIAAYLHTDVTIIRIIFVGLTLLTKGGFALAYFVLALVIPVADTSEERAAAHGQLFNAQELIDRAKKNYADFRAGRDWRRHWRREHREWKRQRRDMRRQQRWGWDGWDWAGGWGASNPPTVSPGGYGIRMFTGLMVPILSIVSAVFFWFWVWAVVSLATRGHVFGQSLPDDIPLWAGILILVALYHAIAWPLHLARRRAAYYSVGGAQYGLMAAWDGMMSLGFVLLVLWLAYNYVPEIREFIQTLPDVWDSIRYGSAT